MFRSTTFKGTRIVVPDDSYKFFAQFFDLGTTQNQKKTPASTVGGFFCSIPPTPSTGVVSDGIITLLDASCCDCAVIVL